MPWRRVLERRILLWVSLAFGVGLTLVAWAILVRFRGVSMSAAFEGGAPWPRQAVVGAVAGAAAAALGIVGVERASWLRPLREFSREILGDLQLDAADVVGISLAAGWGEELLFRGALQPVFGIVLTSVTFVLAHGLVDLRRAGMAQFAGFVLLAGFGLGWLAREVGLVAAMVAHAVFDAINLWFSRTERFRDATAPGSSPNS